MNTQTVIADDGSWRGERQQSCAPEPRTAIVLVATALGAEAIVANPRCAPMSAAVASREDGQTRCGRWPKRRCGGLTVQAVQAMYPRRQTTTLAGQDCDLCTVSKGILRRLRCRCTRTAQLGEGLVCGVRGISCPVNCMRGMHWRDSRRMSVLCRVLRSTIRGTAVALEYTKCCCHKTLRIPQGGSSIGDGLRAGAHRSSPVQCSPAA